MKNFKTKLVTTLSIIGFFTMALFFNSCADESVVQVEENSVQEELGKFQKELKIFDENEENSVVVLIGSDDQSVLNMWNAENFNLKLIDRNQSLEDVYASVENESRANSYNEDDSDEVAAEISYTILSKNINVGNKRIILEEVPPYNEDMRGWSYSTHYSVADTSSDHTVTVNVFGRNAWKRGYYGVQYKRYSYSGWSTIVSEWKRIKNNETASHTETPCYRMKARRKYKGTNNSVIIEIEE